MAVRAASCCSITGRLRIIGIWIVASERIKALREAYGPAAAWMDLEAIADYWDDPQASEAEFRRFWLNQPVPLVNPNGIDLMKWSQPPLLDQSVETPTQAALVVDIEADRSSSSIGLASEAGEKTLIMCRHQVGTAWLVPKIIELVSSLNVIDVALTPDQAKAIKPDLVQAGIDFRR
jgi:hypothetical protein